MAFLLIVVTCGNQIANTYSGRINTVLDISTSKVIPGEGAGGDLTYYKSDCGDDIYDLT